MTDPDFVALYERSALKLLRFFAQATLNAQVAADLTAETFATAYAQRDRFDPARGAPEAWVTGIGRNLLHHYVRDRQIEIRARSRLGLSIPQLTDADTERIEALIDFAEVGKRVQSALAALGPDQRQAVTLRVVEGLEYQQIAARIGCSAETAQARVSRGLRELGIQLTLANTQEGTT